MADIDTVDGFTIAQPRAGANRGAQAVDTSTAAVAALMDGVTDGPWLLCAHLANDNENNCNCGYRGAIYAGCSEYAICQPGHECVRGEEGLEPPRLPRNQEIANSRFIAASRQLVPALLAERDAAITRAKQAEMRE